jgi:hypothetical protein
VDAWHARRHDRRAEAYGQAALSRTDRKLPALKDWLDPPRTRKVSPDRAAELDEAFRRAKEISDRVPVRRSPRPSDEHGEGEQHPDREPDPSEEDGAEDRDGQGDGE